MSPWGKHDPNAAPSFHPLVDHCLDVAIAFRHIVSIRRVHSALQSCTGSSIGPLQMERLAVVAYLHDVGKCNWGFQAKSEPGATATTGHVIEGAALLYHSELRKMWPEAWHALLQEMVEWFEEGDAGLCAMLLAAISHHGRPVSDNDVGVRGLDSIVRWWKPHHGLVPMAGLGALAQCVRAAFPAAFIRDGAPLTATAELQQRFAGLVMLADWVGSDTQFFPYRKADTEDRQAVADAAARRAVSMIGLEPPANRPPLAFEATFGFAPSALQELLAERQALEPEPTVQLMLAESDTGSGKTEAALAWFLRLYAQGRVDGLYFALPTRVAARELYGRVCRAVVHAFPDPNKRPGPVLLAVPGYVRVDAGSEPALPDPQGRLWDDDARARRNERLWSSERPKRFLAAPIAVGTIDQAMLSALQVKHALLRSVCLDRHLLVVDEVHASDPYMSEVLKALLDGHTGRGGHALLLSATLGEQARAAYFGRMPFALEAASALPYPALTTRAGTMSVRPTGRRKSVHIEKLERLDDAALLDPLHEALAAGARVLAVCNTVSRANALLRAVEADGRFPADWLFSVNGIACPHHGRFSREDREVLDEAVSARLGKQSAAGPLLLVGTQTLEQSLDIDADRLITDPCPMDVLLQRIGRLHRHDRSRPSGFERAHMLLRAPEGSDLTCFLDARGSLFRGQVGIGRVYADARIVQRTLDLLPDKRVLELPTENRWLVEQATHPEALRTLADPRWRRYAQEVLGRELEQRRQALGAVIEYQPFGEFHYPGGDERITTRIGDENLIVALAHPLSHCFGTLVRSVSVPHYLLPHGIDRWPEQVETQTIEGGFRFVLGPQRYRYTRFGLERDDDA